MIKLHQLVNTGKRRRAGFLTGWSEFSEGSRTVCQLHLCAGFNGCIWFGGKIV